MYYHLSPEMNDALTTLFGKPSNADGFLGQGIPLSSRRVEIAVDATVPERIQELVRVLESDVVLLAEQLVEHGESDRERCTSEARAFLIALREIQTLFSDIV